MNLPIADPLESPVHMADKELREEDYDGAVLRAGRSVRRGAWSSAWQVLDHAHFGDPWGQLRRDSRRDDIHLHIRTVPDRGQEYGDGIELHVDEDRVNGGPFHIQPVPYCALAADCHIRGGADRRGLRVSTATRD